MSELATLERVLTPLNFTPEPDQGSALIIGGMEVGREVLDDMQFTTVHDALGSLGVGLKGPVRQRRWSDEEGQLFRPSVGLLRSAELGNVEGSEALEDKTLGQTLNAWRKLEHTSRLYEEMDATFEGAIISQDKYGRTFLNYQPSEETEADLLEQVEDLQTGLSEVAERKIILPKIDFGLGVAIIKRGRGKIARRRALEEAEAIHADLMEMVPVTTGRLAMAGFLLREPDTWTT